MQSIRGSKKVKLAFIASVRERIWKKRLANKNKYIKKDLWYQMLSKLVNIDTYILNNLNN